MVQPQLEPRPDPDRLLQTLQRQSANARGGRLKVFLGMCPGVGKTYAMLEAAQVELRAGIDLVVGYVETHGRSETDALAHGLPSLPRRSVEHRGVVLQEFDLDAMLARRPQLALVDELAHSNVAGSRHPKRWQDVQELLDAGIDVFTTLNVQHVESRADVVRQVAGVEIRETVPDRVLDGAVLELVDLPVAELLERLRAGKVYLGDRAAAAAEHFFREGNLTALRELSLRLVADHVGADTQELRRSLLGAGTWKTTHRLLVGVGPSPYSESLLRWTRRAADSLRCEWLAVHVAPPLALPPSAEAQLGKNLATARELGAEVIHTSDTQLVRGLLRVAREHNATQIVVGKPGTARWLDWWRSGRFLRQLARESGDIDLHVVRADKAWVETEEPWRPELASPARQYLIAFATLGITGMLNLAFTQYLGPRVPGLVFLMVVVVLALFLGRGPVLFAGAISALAWNFLFLPPRFTLLIEHAEDAVLFGTYFVVTLVLGQLVSRIRLQERAERRREARTAALYELTRKLADVSSRDEVVGHLMRHLTRSFQAPAAVCFPTADNRLVAHPDGNLALDEKELAVAGWAFRQGRPAGHQTENLPGAEALHLPLTTERKAFGVLALRLPDRTMEPAQRELLEAFVRQAALVLDRLELRSAAEQARLLAESERLSRALLNSISHELRTPLAASTSAVDALVRAGEAPTPMREGLLAEIQEANARLNRVVGNLLDVARLESGKVLPRPDWYDACDLVRTTVRELRRELAHHPPTLALPSPPLLAYFDFTLVQHALANLLINAATHTPDGTAVEVLATQTPDELILSVVDHGPGIDPAVLPRIFDKFFRAPGARAGGSGLGLTIARGFIEAQSGTLTAANRPEGGAIFTIRLPQAAVPPPSATLPAS